MEGIDIKASNGAKPLECSVMNIPEVNEEGLLQASALTMALSIVNPFLLKCALRLKIPDIIWRAGPSSPLTLQQIASQLTPEAPDLDALSRILTCLSSMGILRAIKPAEDDLEIKGPVETMNMKYTLTNLSKTYFVSEHISSLSLVPQVLLLTHTAFWPMWDHIHDRVLHGGDNFQNSSGGGKDFWSYAAGNPEANHAFNAAMMSITKVNMKEILNSYDGFKDVNTLVDLGGGHGEVISQIIAVYPHIDAINFDLPHVIATAPLRPGITHISGNMFESVPSGDAILMKHILHLWDDENCVKLLKMCYSATSGKGKLIIVDAVLDIIEDSDPVGSGQLMDVTMLAAFRGARERTQEQWNEILQSAGFSISKILGRKGSLTKIVEALKC